MQGKLCSGVLWFLQPRCMAWRQQGLVLHGHCHAKVMNSDSGSWEKSQVRAKQGVFPVTTTSGWGRGTDPALPCTLSIVLTPCCRSSARRVNLQLHMRNSPGREPPEPPQPTPGTSALPTSTLPALHRSWDWNRRAEPCCHPPRTNGVRGLPCLGIWPQMLQLGLPSSVST